MLGRENLPKLENFLVGVLSLLGAEGSILPTEQWEDFIRMSNAILHWRIEDDNIIQVHLAALPANANNYNVHIPMWGGRSVT